MILLGIEIFVATYVGAKVIDKLTTEKTPPNAVEISKKVQRPLKNIKNNENEKVDTHLKVSTAALGLTTISYLYLPVLTPLAIATTSYATLPILKKTETNWLHKRKKLDNTLLNSVVTVTCIVTGHYFIASMATWFFHFSDKMVTKIQDNTKQKLTNIFTQQPKTVWVLKEKVEVEILLETLQTDDIVVINTGEVIAIDGFIIKGIAMIDQHTLTGESVPVEKGIGDKVFASTIIVSGRIYLKIEKSGTDTTISQIGNILLHTTDFKMTLQTKGEKWANGVATPLLITGGFSAPLVGIMPAMTILYSSPGNMIKTLSSLQLLSHLTLLSQKGILVKDGRTLETIPKIDTMLFDKTGTLTKEHPEVGEIFTFGTLSKNQILTYAAIAEQRLAHPIAHAIRNKANESGLLLSVPHLASAHYQIGYGITVSLANDTIHVGSIRFMDQQGIMIPKEIPHIKTDLQNHGSSLIIISVNNQVEGAIEIRFPIRPEVKTTIKALRQRGVKSIAIVSGDHEQPTKRLATLLEVDDYFYDVLPIDKANIVEKLQAEGKTVCFVGDGINDAIAIKKANVSISLNGATSIATDLAQVVLMNDNLMGINDLFEVSHQLTKKTQQTLFICASYGITTFTAGAFFHFGLVFPLTVGTAQYIIALAHATQPLTDKRVNSISSQHTLEHNQPSREVTHEK